MYVITKEGVESLVRILLDPIEAGRCRSELEKMLEIKEEHDGTLTPLALVKMNLSALMVLLGGLIIRLTFVYAGQLSKFT